MSPPVSVELPQLSETNEAKHRNAARLFEQERFTEAVRLLSEILAAEETGAVWNDWATAEFALGQVTEAEHGFRRALELAPGDRQVAENLGAVLASRHRLAEAIRFLEESLGEGNDGETSPAALLLSSCQKQLSEWLAEFRKQIAEPRAPLDQIPRWPLDQMALHLAKQGDLDTAMKSLNFNLHFSPENLGMIKMRECIRTLLAERHSVEGNASGRKLATPLSA